MAERPKVLLVDDDPAVITALGRLLEGFAQLRFATGGVDALQLVAHWQPDLVLLDVQMPDLSGFDVCERMKRDPQMAEVPVIFVTAHDDVEQELRGLELGAADFIAKPPRGPLVQARVRTQLRVKHMADALRLAAATDGLTGLFNRRNFDEVAQREWRRARRSGAPLAVMLIDIDHFKAYNDHYGHPAGDRCLQAVAGAMQGVIRRGGDLLARYGGEEFVILLPETDVHGAQVAAGQLLRAVDAMAWPHEASPVAPVVSISIGLSCCTMEPLSSDATGEGAPPSLERLIHAADEALYAAKKSGRRRACELALQDLGRGERAVTVATVAPVTEAVPAATVADGLTAVAESHLA